MDVDLMGLDRKAVFALCDWPDADFQFKDEPGEHDPCYLIMPGGAMLAFAHHGQNGVDQARARFIVDACNEKMQRLLYAEENCPGHVASPANAKICGRCGIHIDSLRP